VTEVASKDGENLQAVNKLFTKANRSFGPDYFSFVIALFTLPTASITVCSHPTVRSRKPSDVSDSYPSIRK
jgi:hypothetical protein